MWKYLWVFVPVVAHADMSECVNIADQNKKIIAWLRTAAVLLFATKSKILNHERIA
jgi:hypothetical protein